MYSRIAILLLLPMVAYSEASARDPAPESPADIPATPALPFIAGIPYEEALAILRRHESELIKLPGCKHQGLSTSVTPEPRAV